MKLIADTHVMIWALKSPEQLPDSIRKELESEANEVFFSAASIWEAEIKKALGKLDWPDDAVDQLKAFNISILSIDAVDAIAAARLPRHHGDPFDRMIVAHALRYGLTLLTADRRMTNYSAPILQV